MNNEKELQWLKDDLYFLRTFVKNKQETFMSNANANVNRCFNKIETDIMKIVDKLGRKEEFEKAYKNLEEKGKMLDDLFAEILDDW